MSLGRENVHVGAWNVYSCDLNLCGIDYYSGARLSTLGLASVLWGSPQGHWGRRTDLVVRPKSCAVCGKKFYMEYFFPLTAQVLGRVLASQMSLLCTPVVLAVRSKALVRHGSNVRHHAATVHIPRPNMHIFTPQALCASLGQWSEVWCGMVWCGGHLRDCSFVAVTPKIKKICKEN